MEFYPAHQAYQNVKTTGFRTFLKKNGTVFEPFSDENITQRMQIHMNGLAIEEQNRSSGMDTKVVYYTLPGENVGALVRVVSVTNQSGEPIELELLDGMPAVIPYGVSMDSMKNMGQTAKAWMQVEDLNEGLPYYRVRASMDDTAAVRRIDGGNFSACCEADGRRLQPIVDPSLVFSYDLSLKRPVGFEERPLKELLLEEQMTQNLLPCSFYGITRTLAPGGSVTLYELIGQVENKQLLKEYFAEKKEYAKDGIDDVEFRISLNQGQPVKPLTEVASGGELSRIMLAIKAVMADKDEIETLIFDEIDVGISGRTAQKVSEKMALIGKEHQVICITHLAQIAAMADRHFLIEKKTEDAVTRTKIYPLNEENSVEELARILGGARITDTVVQSAREMKNLASQMKYKM